MTLVQLLFFRIFVKKIMESIKIPLQEYNKMKEELMMLKNNSLIKKMNKLIDILYEQKYGLYLGDYTDDLTGYSLDNCQENESAKWDEL